MSAPGDIAVVAIVPDHLLAVVGHMGAHGGLPLQRIKGLLVFSILRSVDDLGFFRDVGHPLLRERGSDDIASKVLHDLIVAGSNPGAAMDVESARGG